MLNLKGRLRSILKCAGKGETKVASVFAINAEASHRAVLHLREGAPGVPIWLFMAAEPFPETAALCERVYRETNALALVATAQSELWPYSVAISVGTWTGESGGQGMKLAPFLIPPFRALILNKDGGFFRGSPSNIYVHCVRAILDGAKVSWGHGRDAGHSAGIRMKWAVHTLRVKARDLFRGLGKLAAATALLILATLLKWISNPHFFLFKRLHGKHPLMQDVEPSSGDSVATFIQSGSDWDGESLDHFLRFTDARWVLWRNDRTDFLTDGCSLFNDERTFAVSRQTHFRGWKNTVASMAPFRKLQAGEATQVLAPLSGAILVDRKKLLALGIPRCTLSGTAWLILFWKAAAAGWRSYSVGGDYRVPEQPDFPIQDTAFVLEAIFDPALRRLTARDEDLSRGNIAFSPARRRPSEANPDRLKVLIVSPFLPFPMSHGGAVRIYNLCRELSDRVDFTLIAMREANDVVDYGRLHEVFREVYVVDKDERTPRNKTLPAQVSASESRSLSALIGQLSRKLNPDVVQFEYTHFAAFRDSAPGIPALLVEHDLTFSLYGQLAEANPTRESRREYQRWLEFERKWLESYEGVWTVSEEDRVRAIEEGRRSENRTFAIPNGVELKRFRPEGRLAEAPEILYVGSFRHLPNVIGFENLCGKIMPRVWAKSPEARLRVVAGPEHERYWPQRNLDSRIEIHGFVEDLQPLYSKAWVVAVPLEISAGTNIKVLEAMACGKAVVSTPVGCAGLDLLDDYDALIRGDWDGFADALYAILSGEKSGTALGERARRTVEHFFSWSTIADRAYESYLELAGHASRSLSESTLLKQLVL